MKILTSIATVLTLVASPTVSHEFWIDAHKYQVEIGENIAADLKNGQDFKGIDLAYFERRIVRFDQIDTSGRRPVASRPGDSPAFNAAGSEDGLFTLVYQSTYDTVNYATWEKFQRFVDHKAFGDVRSQHDARGLPEEGFKEAYARFAKALIAVGSGAGADAARGLEIEIVALKNPYTEDVSAGLPVQVLYREMPRIGAQVEIFERPPEGPVRVSTTTTDDDGIALIAVKPGHDYLLDNVLLRIPSEALAEEKSAVWETLWAALTFAVPGEAP